MDAIICISREILCLPYAGLKKNDLSNQSKFLFNLYILKVCVSSAFGIHFRPQEEVSEPVMLTLLKYLNNKHILY